METKSNSGNRNATKLRVRYETTEVKYGSQFVVNANNEDITVNCSAGYINDPHTNENLLPVHTRLVLTPSGAKRLIETLQQALDNVGDGSQAKNNVDASALEASLPKIN